MKKNLAFLLIGIVALLAVNISRAQAPEKFKYQAVLRDASGNIIGNSAQTVVVNLLQGSSSGTSVYQETHSVTTTPQGVINMDIGGGTVNNGTFATINWSTNTYWIKVTVGGVVISNGQLLSTPYALSVKGITYDATNSRVGIGMTPSYTLDVNGVIRASVDNGVCFRVGNDATINDINLNNHIGIYGAGDATIGSIKLGSGGGILSGYNNNIGIGITTPGQKLSVAGVIHSSNNNSECFRVGDDAGLWDINDANLLGVYGVANSAVGGIKLGSGGGYIYGTSGKIGIGTTSPDAKFTVNGDISTLGGGDIMISGGTGGVATRFWNDLTELYIQTQGRNMVRINTQDGLTLKSQDDATQGGQIKFEGVGENNHYIMDNSADASAEDFRVIDFGTTRAYMQNGSNGWKTPSDRRLKDHIVTLSVLEKIDLVRGTSYTLKDSGKPQIGVIAQEMQEAFPVAVCGNETAGYLGVDYNAVAAIALQGVKELKARVEKLEKENAQLRAEKSDLNALRAEVDALKAMITAGQATGSK